MLIGETGVRRVYMIVAAESDETSYGDEKVPKSFVGADVIPDTNCNASSSFAPQCGGAPALWGLLGPMLQDSCWPTNRPVGYGA